MDPAKVKLADKNLVFIIIPTHYIINNPHLVSICGSSWRSTAIIVYVRGHHVSMVRVLFSKKEVAPLPDHRVKTNCQLCSSS